MNSENQQIEKDSSRQSEVLELLKPTSLPEAGFQSYEMLSNDATHQKADFLDGKTRNPQLRYPKLENDLSEMDKGILHLAEAIEKLEHLVSEPDTRRILQETLGYRMDEMDFIKILAQLNYAADRGDAEVANELASKAKSLSEQLYGMPQEEIVTAAFNTVWNEIDGKEFIGKAAQLRDDLIYGFTSAEGLTVSPLRRGDGSEMVLPEYGEAVAWAGEYFEEKNADIEALLQNFWDEKAEEYGEEYACDPNDIIEAFQRVIELRDPDGTSGVSVIPSQGKTALSWETPLMAVQVGTERQPIPTSRMLFTRNHHEFGHHGQKAIDGLKTTLPVLGTGLYTKDSEYLTFEEGFATVIEAGMDGEQAQWSGGKINYYLGVALAAEGDDFRSVFEKTWRYNLLQKTDLGDVTEEDIAKARNTAYTNCVRIFRGTPPDLKEKTGCTTIVTYNKDLAYLAGAIKAIQYVDESYRDRDYTMLDFAMKGKFDPTNPTQRDIALRYTS
ncbi:MAG: hypothetical protein WBB33_01695 [Candidatus Saccharimonadales bacterium]